MYVLIGHFRRDKEENIKGGTTKAKIVPRNYLHVSWAVEPVNIGVMVLTC